MVPIKDLLTKFEQIMKASDKMFLEYEKKLAKKDDQPLSNAHS